MMLYVGRIAAQKGLATLIAALGEVRCAASGDEKVIAGVDESGHQQELCAQVERLGLSALRVSRADVRRGQAERLRGGRICSVLPSLSARHFRSRVLEAPGAGSPC